MQAEIKGSTMPILEVSLQNGEAVVTPHGELAWMTTSIRMSQTMNTGNNPGGGGLMRGLKRMLGGGGLFLTRYDGPGSISFAAKVPGHIVPVDISGGHFYLVHRHGWLAGTPGITPSVALQQSFRGGLWGGEGFVLQKLEGDGRAWVELGGEVTTYDLPPGQTVLVHPGHIGMFQETVGFDITFIRGIRNALFGADGLFIAKLTGPGKIWLQSMSLPHMAHAIAHYLPHSEGGGGLGGLLTGS